MNMKYKVLLMGMSIMMINACSQKRDISTVDEVGRAYVKEVLRAGLYDADFVDAYYGPKDWKPAPLPKDSNTVFPAKVFLAELNVLKTILGQVDTVGASDADKQRIIFLDKQITAVQTKIEMINNKKFTFDEEAKLLYDAEPPVYTEDYFKQLLGELEKELPGKGTLTERYDNFKKQFIIPKEKVDAVFQAAIAEAKKRTRQFIALPDSEDFHLEYVTDKSWSGYNWYQGGYKSLIQINTQFPIYIDRAVDLACHEGYPGHHVFNVLIEQNLVNAKGWKEFTVYPLFSPQSLIAEGSANYGIDVAFPGEERIQFERDVLFPLAGLNKNLVEKYYHVLELVGKLSYAGNEAARGYLNGNLTKEQAVQWLVDYSLMTPERAAQRIRFIEQYRSYVINYNYGQDLVKNYIEKNGGTKDHPDVRWELFAKLLSQPLLPSQLK